MADEKASDTILMQTDPPEADEWESLSQKRRDLKHTVLDAVRTDLGLGMAKVIDPGPGGS